MDGTDLARVVSTKASYEFDASDPRSQMGEPLLAEGFIQKAKRVKHPACSGL